MARIKSVANKLRIPVSKIENIELENVNLCCTIQFPFSMKGADKSYPLKAKQDFLALKHKLYNNFFLPILFELKTIFTILSSTNY